MKTIKITPQKALELLTDYALKRRIDHSDKYIIKAYSNTIKEAISKETPMKPIGLEDEYNVTYVIKFTHMCSHCNDNFLSISDKYCKECGQKIDWSDEE